MPNTTAAPAELQARSSQDASLVSSLNFDQSKVQFTEHGLVLAEGIEFEEWKAIGYYIRRVARSIEWAIGDWLAYGEFNYKDKVYSKRMPNGVYELASQIFGIAASTLKNYKYVAVHFNSSSRHDKLTLSHGYEIVSAKVPETHYPIWAKEVVDGGLTTRQLRHKLRDSGKDHAPEPLDKPKPTIFGQANKFTIAFVHECRDWDKKQADEMAEILAPIRDWLRARGEM
jgi:hypothetical protein